MMICLAECVIKFDLKVDLNCSWSLFDFELSLKTDLCHFMVFCQLFVLLLLLLLLLLLTYYFVLGPSWAMRKLGVEEWLVSAVMSMYTGAKTVVRTVYGGNGYVVDKNNFTT